MSDHISGPRALADPIADITDVYAFPSPETPDRLVLVLNTLPFAQPDAAFSDGLIYRFRLRPLTRRGRGRRRRPSTSGSRSSSSTASSVRGQPRRDASRHCRKAPARTPTGESVTFRVERPERGGADTGSASSPGARWDPFFMDAPAALKTIATQQLCFTDPGIDLPRREERPVPGRRARPRPPPGRRDWSASSPRP